MQRHAGGNGGKTASNVARMPPTTYKYGQSLLLFYASGMISLERCRNLCGTGFIYRHNALVAYLALVISVRRLTGLSRLLR